MIASRSSRGSWTRSLGTTLSCCRTAARGRSRGLRSGMIAWYRLPPAIGGGGSCSSGTETSGSGCQQWLTGGPLWKLIGIRSLDLIGPIRSMRTQSSPAWRNGRLMDGIRYIPVKGILTFRLRIRPLWLQRSSVRLTSTKLC